MSILTHQNIDYIQLGYCSAVHGIKGGFVFTLFNPTESVLKNGDEILLKLKNGVRAFTIEDISFGNKVIVYLKDVKDRTEAEKLTPFEIFYPRGNFPEIQNESEYYLVDLVGLELFDHQTKKRLGKILGHYDNKNQVILSLVINGEKLDLPFTKNFFPLIDIKEKRVEINLPEYI